MARQLKRAQPHTLGMLVSDVQCPAARRSKTSPASAYFNLITLADCSLTLHSARCDRLCC